jgi:prepilin-type N-terminal cleavage/methylation domain-containing protein
MSQNPTSSPVRPHRVRGFTLIEMITVLTIIILVLAIAIPVWNALMGGTNVAAAQNQISAFLANVRADAIYNRQTIGVFFFIDPKTKRTAMAEVQVQPEWITGTQTPLFTPNVPSAANSTPVNVLELVNNLDPNSTTGSPSFVFYRDMVLLPNGVGIALNSNTYAYNQFIGTQFTPNVWNTGSFTVPLDRYRRLGAIMFAADGTLTTISYGVPLREQLAKSSPISENLLCQRMGMTYPTSAIGPFYDFASLAPPTSPTQTLTLVSSVALVVFDEDAYLTQHASSPTTPNGDGAPFNDTDMNDTILPAGANPLVGSAPAQDKFIEENWIDENGIALMISPSNGSLIRAK